MILNTLYYGIMLVITTIWVFMVVKIMKKYFTVTHNLTQYQAGKKAKLQAMYFRAMNDTLHFRSLSMLASLRDRFFNASDSFQHLTSHLSFFSQRWLGMRLMTVRGFMVLVAFIIPFLIREYGITIYLTKQW